MVWLIKASLNPLFNFFKLVSYLFDMAMRLPFQDKKYQGSTPRERFYAKDFGDTWSCWNRQYGLQGTALFNLFPVWLHLLQFFTIWQLESIAQHLEPDNERIEIKPRNFYCGIHHVVHFTDVMSSIANEAEIAKLRLWHVKNVVSSAVPSSVLLYTRFLLARFSFPFQIDKVNITLRAPLGVNVDRPRKDF